MPSRKNRGRFRLAGRIDRAKGTEATEVHVTLPEILTDAPIIVTDNGSGMKEKELRTDYLNIASPRLSRKGEQGFSLSASVGDLSRLGSGERNSVKPKARRAERAGASESLGRGEVVPSAFIAQQAKRRLEFLDYLDRLASDPKTTEQQMHHALQNSLWVFGPEYTLMASNEQLQSIIREYADQHYEGPDAKDRPDLYLAGNILKQHLLIEFKRPSARVGRKAEAQANEYADTLTGRLGMSLQILIIGGEVDPKLQDEYTGTPRLSR